jgi:hypothetical protein
MNKPVDRKPELRSALSSQQGAVAVIVAISLAVLIPMLALVLDIGQALVVKQSLQNLADAAALAGARQLGRGYETLPPGTRSRALPAGGRGQVNGTVADVGGKNQPPNHPASVLSTLGVWNAPSRALAGGGALPDGVRVSAQTQVPTFVASAVGVKSMAVSAEATAALTGLSQVPAGSLTLPFGVARGWFSGKGWASRSFTLTKNGTSPVCAAWSTFTQTPATQKRLQTIVKEIQTGKYSSPIAKSGQTQFQFLGARPGAAFTELQSLYKSRKDPNTGDWLTVVPVYDRGTCASATGRARIVGFATMKLRQTSSTRLSATVVTNQIRPGRGGGVDYGTKGSIPGLVN